ncbi:unnamed protein product [Heterobilharzia americana]|nr:unnamed protein product [Heterobilharzia americana]
MCSRTSVFTVFGVVILIIHLHTQYSYELKNSKQHFESLIHNSAKKSAFINVYKSELTRRSVTLEQFNLSSEVINYAGRIGHIIKALENSLKMLVSWTEEEISKYSWNPKLLSKGMKYNDLRELKPDDDRLTDQPGYQFKVMLNKSGVHLPVEVYGGDPTVFHTLRWTEVLDSIFPTEPNLHFTYFASLTGILRVYPAFPWREKTVDMFDVRKRSWSGSMTGQSLKLANLSAQKLIESLDVDDYFTVAHFPGAKDHVAPMIVTANNESEPICFNSFVQATKRNKLRLFHDMSTLKARGYSDFSGSLKFAYEMFRNLTGSARGDRGKEMRNKILVLMTDNAFVFDESVLSQLKQQKSNITTFIYSLGEPVGAAYEHTVKACATNDYYQYLPTVGAVSNLMKDFHDKATQIRFGPNKSPLPTAVILHGASDILHTDQYKGTGLMVSISMPVYNRTKKLEFLGLMGTELPITLMTTGLPQSKLFPVGYAFVVNTNGYLVFHPSLVPEYTWLDDTPYLDFLDVELNVYGSKTMIRRKLIDNVRGCEHVTDFIKVSDNIHTYVKPRLYSFTRLPNTDFGVAFVVPTDQHLFLNIPKDVGFSISTHSSGDYMIDQVPIQNLIRKAKVILPWKAIDPYYKINYHFFNLESAEEHAKLHKDEDELEWRIMESQNLNGKDDKNNDQQPLTAEDLEETGDMNADKQTEYVEDGNSTQKYPSVVIMSNESTSAHIEIVSDNTLCVDNTNSTDCLSEKPLLPRKVSIRSVQFMNGDNGDKSGNLVDDIDTDNTTKTTTTSMEKSDPLLVLPSKDAKETTVAQPSELVTSSLNLSNSHSFEVNSEFMSSSLSSELTKLQTSPTLAFTTEVVDFQLTKNEAYILGNNTDNPATVSTEATNTGNLVLEPVTQMVTDEKWDEISELNQVDTEEQVQMNDFKRFLDQIKNVNFSQSELLLQILLEIIVAEKDVTESAESVKFDGDIRSRTIALNTGLIWTLPINSTEDFYDELKHWPNSPIFQRVFDSHGLIFWISLRRNQDKSDDNHNSSVKGSKSNITATPFKDQITFTHDIEDLLRTEGSPEAQTEKLNSHEKGAEGEGEETSTESGGGGKQDSDNQKYSELDIIQKETFEEPFIEIDENDVIMEDQELSQMINNDEEEKDNIDNTPLPVTIFTPITITQGQDVYKAGVLGITLEPEHLSKQLNLISECVDSSSKLCYLLEDAANIIAVNNQSLYYQIGQFLGHVDPQLMNSLIQNHVYGVLKDYDFEGTCYPREDKSESASPGIHPIPSILIHTRNIFSMRLWLDWLLTFGSLSVIVTRTFITGLITAVVSGNTKDDVDPQNKPYQCIELINRYYSLNSEIYETSSPRNLHSSRIFRGFISCSLQRNRDWSVQSISGTNLQLIITDPIFDECDKSAVKLQRDPVKDPGPDVCEASRAPRYRRQSQKWTSVAGDDEVEIPVHCSSTNRLTFLMNHYIFLCLIVPFLL